MKEMGVRAAKSFLNPRIPSPFKINGTRPLINVAGPEQNQKMYVKFLIFFFKTTMMMINSVCKLKIKSANATKTVSFSVYHWWTGTMTPINGTKNFNVVASFK